jgi:hypothetical protein
MTSQTWSLIQPYTWADDFICRHFLKDYEDWLENIWRNVVHINFQNNVSSNIFQNTSSSLADDTVKIQNDENGVEWAEAVLV